MKFIKLFLLLVLFCVAKISYAKEVEVFSYNQHGQLQNIKVPYDPKRIAVLDMASLDIIDSLALGNRVVATSKSTKLAYLDKYLKNKDIINAGTVKEADLQALMEANVDLIIIGPRLNPMQEKLSKIAPVICVKLDYTKNYLDCVKQNTYNLAKIFNHTADLKEIFSSFDRRIKNIYDKANGKSALVILSSANHMRFLGSNVRANIISTSMGFKNLTDNSTNHGNEASFELIASLDPDYIFVLDRDVARSLKATALSKALFDNNIIKATKAYKQKHIIYLDSTAWYLAEGGISTTNLMLMDIEKALGI